MFGRATIRLGIGPHSSSYHTLCTDNLHGQLEQDVCDIDLI